MRTRDRVPKHLRQFVVEQDYGAYDEIDQAVWRFVLLQIYGRLCETAHAAYRDGLARTGIRVDRIPEIAEMDRCLAEYGWGAVAVDGFIPPRAVQEFQALGILTIAVDIRRPEHLAYTPAPDIIHESAGHAPIVPDAQYREYLQRFGRIGARAFSSPQDRRIYQAVHALSELKERPGASADEIAQIQRELAEAEASQRAPSEAALLSRLHWWTVEYGLVGSPEDYRIYGAGLLSSLGESHFCHEPGVRKLPLSARCIDVEYDITRPQPQLFVAEDFAHLTRVLEEVAAGLAQAKGGAVGLARALASEELATIELDSGLQISGILDEVIGGPDAPCWLRFREACMLAHGDRMLDGHSSELHAQGYSTPLGPLADGSSIAARVDRCAADHALELRFASGVVVSGRLAGAVRSRDGELLVATLADCSAHHGERVLYEPDWGPFDLGVGQFVRSAFAGPADPVYFSETSFPERRVPRPHLRVGDDAALLALYRRALRLWEKPESPDLVPGFEAIGEALRDDFPDDWLLRWNLLESLAKTGTGDALAAQLRAELLEIEQRFPSEAPVSTGLHFLAERYGG
jgi:phenylalanine-4-hydroxylase